MACEILVSRSRIEPEPQHRKYRVLIPGPPGKSLKVFYKRKTKIHKSARFLKTCIREKKKKKLLEFVKSQYRQLEVNQKSSPYFKEKRERLLMWLWTLLLSFQGQGLEHSFSITEESGAWSQACSAAWRRASSPVPFLFSLLFAGWLHGPNILLCTSLFTPTGKGLAFIWEINRALSHRCKR